MAQMKRCPSHLKLGVHSLQHGVQVYFDMLLAALPSHMLAIVSPCRHTPTRPVTPRPRRRRRRRRSQARSSRTHGGRSTCASAARSRIWLSRCCTRGPSTGTTPLRSCRGLRFRQPRLRCSPRALRQARCCPAWSRSRTWCCVRARGRPLHVRDVPHKPRPDRRATVRTAPYCRICGVLARSHAACCFAAHHRPLALQHAQP
jgi:hypothetical protein